MGPRKRKKMWPARRVRRRKVLARLGSKGVADCDSISDNELRRRKRKPSHWSHFEEHPARDKQCFGSLLGSVKFWWCGKDREGGEGKKKKRKSDTSARSAEEAIDSGTNSFRGIKVGWASSDDYIWQGKTRQSRRLSLNFQLSTPPSELNLLTV